MLLDYEFPTRVIMQEDALAAHSELLKEFGSHAMLVMDGVMADDHPAKQEILFSLDFNNIKRTIFLHTRKVAPSISNLEAGAALARESQVDFVIAVGCDATLEAGKAIAVLAAQDPFSATLLSNDIEAPLPVVCIPTEPGSGTEVTPEIHVAQHGLDRLTLVRNPLCAPTLTFLDPRYTLHMDNTIVVSNYIKTLGRAIEAIVSEKANPISDAMAIAALGTVSDLAGPMLNLEDNAVTLEQHSQLMLAAHEAGLAIAVSGANILEALASPLTYVRKIHLGQAYGLIIPPLVSFLMDRAPLVSDVILQSLYFSRLESLEDFLWTLIDAIVPIDSETLERCANAAADNPLIKDGAISLEFKDLTSCYAHLLADESER